MTMTDSNDPFAERPYVPPAERDKAPAPSDGAESEPAAAPEAPAPSAAEAPAAETDTANEPTVPVPTAPPAGRVDTAAETDAAYTHRFPGAADAGSARETTQTQTLPPFEETARTQPTDGDEPPTGRRLRGRSLAGAVAVVVLAGASGVGGAALYDAFNDDDGGTTVSSLDTGNTTNAKAPSGAVENVAQKVLPSVVQINVKGSEESGSGTGIIISSDGDILTNNHVVEVAADDGSITVAFNNGTNAEATIVGTDPVTDLAVIKAKGKSGLTPASLGSSADLQVGQEVVAIGSPFGLESTVTSGIISALNRPVTSSDGGDSDEGSLSNTFPAVQTDAAINPGNSGGPLVDMDGNVIAINSAIRSNGTTSADSGSIGLGFAIPIDLAKNVSKHLVKGEKVQHAKIGVTVSPAVSGDGITGVGAEVKEVTSGGAGDKAGLKEGDIITAVNGNLVASSEALVASVRGYEPGEKITITYKRDGKTSTTDVTLDSDGGNLGS
jgi:putative serine protease PepD